MIELITAKATICKAVVPSLLPVAMFAAIKLNDKLFKQQTNNH